MFKFSDGTLIEGQADLVKTLNNKYSSIKNVWSDNVGAYDLNAYNDTADYVVDKIVFEAGAKSSSSKTNRSDVLRYWRDEGYKRGNDCKLHYFSYTNNTDSPAQVYVTVHDYFQNNEISFCTWDGDYVGFSFLYSSGSGSSSSSSSYNFGWDSDIDARIHVNMNGEYKKSRWKYEKEISAPRKNSNNCRSFC